MTRLHSRAYRQTGSALIVALIFLLLMTVIGTSAMQSSTIQERMAGNWRDWNLAFQSAEAALRDGERYLLDTAVLPEFLNADGLYEVNDPNRPSWHGGAFSDGAGFLEYDGDLADVVQPPRYYIERLATLTPAGTETETGTVLEEVAFFRVTAVGYGGVEGPDGEPVTAVTLSTIYRSR
jgi:type IV pilus assembly protein PilX